MMKQSQLKAKFIISRASGGQADEHPIHIELTDELSGCRVVSLWMRLDEFAKAITASYGEAIMDYYPDAPIGQKLETKTVIVPFTMANGRNEAAPTKALKPFEIDGWSARRSDMTNHHCYVPDKGQRVVFHRHVLAERTDKVNG
jgi:hypothetical protein